MGTALLALWAALAGSARAAQVGGHSSPYFFAEDDNDLRREEPKVEAQAPAPPPPGAVPLDLRKLRHFAEGRYRAPVRGLLCNACAMALVENLKKIKGVSAASLDFEEGLLRFTVAKGARVRVGQVERAVRHAGRRAGLGAKIFLEALFEDKK